MKHPTKRVILLNGPSSSGKSTLAKALKSRIEETSREEYGIVSIDDFLRCSRDETIYEEDVFEIGGKLCEALRKSLDSRPGVIVDHVITSRRIFAQFKEAVGEYEVWTVHVTCPLGTLMEREKTRGNRCPGSAEASHRFLFPRDGYDVTVDTGVLQPAEAAASICRELRKKRGLFARVLEQKGDT